MGRLTLNRRGLNRVSESGFGFPDFSWPPTPRLAARRPLAHAPPTTAQTENRRILSGSCTSPRLWRRTTGYRRKPLTLDQSERLETIMIFGKKSDLKNHLSVKKSTWAHKVVARSPHEQNSEMERERESPPERDLPPKAEREPMQPRY